MEPLLTEAIVVRLVDHGEADRVVTLLTKSHGKVGALARGVRKSWKRFGGMAPFAVGEAQLKRRRGDLWSLEGFTPAAGPQVGPGAEVAVVAHAAYLCELARELVPDEAADARLHALVAGALSRLAEGGAVAWRLRAFEASLLDALGLAPSLERCVGCGVPVGEAPTAVDARRGGVLCGACSPLRRDGARAHEGPPLLSAVARAALSDPSLDAPTDGAPLARLTVDDARAVRDALQALLHQHLRYPLRSLEFIAKLNADAARSRTAP